jgi:hypothetical protein
MRPLRDGGEIRLYAADAHISNRPTGEYDNTILCAECDNSFSPWEKYTATLLFDDPQYKKRTPNKTFISVKNYDYAALKLCLLSILWKMSLSAKEVFQDIKLGRYENEIRDMLLQKNPGTLKQLPIFIARYSDRIGWLTMYAPARARVNGVNVYTYGLPGHRIYVLVDQRPHPYSEVLKMSLQPDKPLRMFVTQWETAKNAQEHNETFHTFFGSIYRQKRRHRKLLPLMRID